MSQSDWQALQVICGPEETEEGETEEAEEKGPLGPVDLGPDVFPGALGRRPGILGRPVLEKIGVLGAVQHGVQPGQGIGLDPIDRLQAELAESPVGDIADVVLDPGRKNAGANCRSMSDFAFWLFPAVAVRHRIGLQ